MAELAAAGGTVSGTGQIIGPDGKVKAEFTLISDPLTQEQADAFNHQEALKNGSNTSSSSS